MSPSHRLEVRIMTSVLPGTSPPAHASPSRRACPFCGSTTLGEIEVEPGEWVVSCLECQAIGPTGRSTGAAIRRWNGGSIDPARLAK
jgi:hypothetical protein